MIMVMRTKSEEEMMLQLLESRVKDKHTKGEEADRDKTTRGGATGRVEVR
jgi:hypothetical protein